MLQRPISNWARSRCLPVFATLTFAAAAQTQAELVPWFFGADGEPVLKRHEHAEDTGNTVFMLAWDFVTLANQPEARPDALLLNAPLFDPPEGLTANPGQRRLLRASIESRALQMYVNAAGAPVGQLGGPSFLDPTFFVSTPTNLQLQTLTDVGLHQVFIAPTRAALGVVGPALAPHSRFPLLHEPPEAWQALNPAPMNALYVTAGVAPSFAEFDAASQADLALATQDRLFLLQGGVWVDSSALIQNSTTLTPANARSENSSGACFADFNGDGYMDIFVGKPGDAFTGARSRLLIYRPASGNFADASAAYLPNLSLATVDVAAADIDGDGDMDIVLANRMRRGGPAGLESIDYCLVNRHPLVGFDAVALSSTPSDSRSVAVGDLDSVAGPEIVLGNAGSDGFSNSLAVPTSEDHPLQIFRLVAQTPPLQFVDDVSSFMGSLNESEMSRPFTWQVLIADVARPTQVSSASYKPDLVLVNHRDILLDAPSSPSPLAKPREASNIRILVNPESGDSRALLNGGRHNVFWATTVALADFSYNHGAGFGDCAAGTLDFLIGAGNSYSGCDTIYMENIGAIQPTVAFNNSAAFQNFLTYDAMPGNERGYGFDFADVNGNGALEMLQTSRGYNYLTIDCAWPTTTAAVRHWIPTAVSSPLDFSNARGMLFPIGAEDAVFADFDLNGNEDLLLATQRAASGTHPDALPPFTFDTVVLRNQNGGHVPAFSHATTTVPLLGAPGNLVVDSYIDVGDRRQAARPTIADRAVAVDLDNDGDEDAIVRLFPISNQTASGPVIPAIGDGGLTANIDEYSTGFRYLRNIAAGPGAPAPWFKDVAPTHMHGSQTGGGFSPYWNRPLGVEVLADFDNNGACDLFSVSHEAVTLFDAQGTDPNALSVTNLIQGFDLLLLNGVSGKPIGELVDSTNAWTVPQRLSSSPPFPPSTIPQFHVLGAGGAAWGDFDNDGDADLLVTCGARNLLSALLINQSPAQVGFVDEFAARVDHDVSQVSAAIHSTLVLGTSDVNDAAGKPIVVDIDGDGDVDIVYPVARNIPRIYRNKGVDSNADGLIDALDDVGAPQPRLGYFEDATDEYLSRVRPIVDSVDSQAVDLDRDGDWDLVFNTFDDEVVPLRNDVASTGGRPTITEAWPRVGAIRGRTIRLEGANLSSAAEVELRCRSTGTLVSVTAGLSVDSLGRLSFTLPKHAGLRGLVQIRVRSTGQPPPVNAWTKQFFGYFVFDN